MFIGLEGLEEQVLAEWLTHSLATRTQSMLQILSKYWKVPTSESHQKFVIWPHVEVGCPSSDAGVLVLVAVMGVVEDTVIRVMVEGMVEGVVEGMVEEAAGDFPLVHVTGTHECGHRSL